eukprot:TRINITY_DN3168_c4_g1_i1.p1 TRINITY_DN3168_c4_g1~~TRINITY_DN3168_c4_g1_i1.p1  ORF type:complete len:643 (+),score=159.43 TRINITY_DN3168_c4_g1_i1:89-2017(+)
MIFKEILVNLLGYKGSFIVVGDNGGWALHEDLQIDYGTRQLVGELLEVGPVVEAIRGFVDGCERGAEDVESVAEKVYSGALCEGVRRILAEYESVVEELYSQAGDPGMSIGQIKASLSHWPATLTTILDLLSEIKSRPTHILSTIEAAVRYGTSRPYLLLILKSVNTVFLTHVANWVIWGTLPTQPGFFIEPGPELVPLFQPMYIPTHLGRKILTIGGYAQRVRQSGTTLLSQDSFTLYSCLTSNEVLRNGALNISLLEDLLTHTEQIIGHDLWRTVYSGKEGLEVQLKGIGDYLLCFKGDFWREFAVESLEILARFGLHALETHTDDRQAAKTKEKIEAVFVKMMSKVSDKDATGCGKRVAFSYVQDAGSLGKLLEPTTFADKAAVSVKFANYLLTATRMMRLEYNLEPHHMDLFAAQGMELLQSTFNHSLYLLFTEVMLSQVWMRCKTITKQLENEARRGGKGYEFRTKNDAKVAAGIRVLKPLMCLRRKMAFFIENLKFYIVTDVLHSRFSSLTDELRSTARTFEQAKLLIKTALEAINRDAFLADPAKANHMILLTIRKAVRCCLQLWYISYTTLRPDDTFRAVSMLADYTPLLAELSASFDKHVSDLYEMLKGSAQGSVYRQFLTRLNFNKYYNSGS